MTEPRVTVTTLRKARLCVKGSRRQCEVLGLDFKRLVKEGLPVSELREIDDAVVQRCVRIAEGKK